MSAVNYLNTISSALIGMISLSGIFVGGYHAIKMIQAEDEYGMVRAKKNIKKTIIGVVLGLTVTGLINYIFRVI